MKNYINILREPDDIKIICAKENVDAVVRTEFQDRKLNVYLKATESRPRMVCLRWNHKITEPTRIMGDKWERGYGDLEWHSLNGEIFMPWYFLANSGDVTVGCGVMVQPNSLVCFQCDASGVTAWLDVRCGSIGVDLRGRELLCGSFVCEKYENLSAFEAAKEFCKVMSPSPILPKEPVYGSNNWYYAYGKSSREEIIEDAKIIADLTKGLSNRPFMVIDDGWTPNSTDGPWIANEKYGDMKSLVKEFEELDVKPGIWIRPLHYSEMEIKRPDLQMCGGIDHRSGLALLDPSQPEVKEYIRETITQIREWGFKLLKHDYSTHDMFLSPGFSLNGVLSTCNDRHFHDETKTTAEIVLDLYRLIREAAGDMVVIGCNTIPHLCAGLVELNRIGDDTSGKTWSRTRAMGVNSLAFRLCQHESFYVADADCVGIMGNNIPWKLNRQWLDLLARSGSPLFVSIQPSALTDEMKEDLKEAFKINSVQKNTAEPLDWLYNNQPQEWLIDGEKVSYDFIMDAYPDLLSEKTQRN